MEYQKMTECEQLIMKCIWDSKEKLSLPDIVERVNKVYGKNWKPQTVSTFLSRLVKKDYLTFYRQSRTFLYNAEVEERDYRSDLFKDCVEFWCAGDTAEFVCELNEKKPFTADEVKRIKALIDELDQ